MLGFPIILRSVTCLGPEISERPINHTVLLIKANADGLSYIRGEKPGWHKGLLAGVVEAGQFLLGLC